MERPIRFGKLIVETKKIPLALCAILLATAILGGYTYQRNGFDFRFPKFIQALLNNQPKLDEGWRSGTCILDQGHPSSEFSPDCVDKIADKAKRPLLFLWGDSHAAALYPGLKHLQDTGAYNFGVAQRTAAVCPPIIGDARPWCNEINTSSFKLIQELKPEIVMMYAYWSHGLDGKGGFGGLYDLSKLDATVAELKKAGREKSHFDGPKPVLEKLAAAQHCGNVEKNQNCRQTAALHDLWRFWLGDRVAYLRQTNARHRQAVGYQLHFWVGLFMQR